MLSRFDVGRECDR